MFGNCKSSLDAWNKLDFGHVGWQIDTLQKHLAWLEVQPMSPGVIFYLRNTRAELNSWLDKEDAMWLQRSKINWFQSGDRNSRCFHSKALARFQKNLISGLMDSNECWQEDMEKVEETIVDYYTYLFSSSNPSYFSELINAVEPIVSHEMNNMLTRVFNA